MDRLGVVGLSFRHSSPEQLALFTRPNEHREDLVRALRQATSAAEVVYVATCNRVEVAYAVSGRSAPQDLRRPIFEVLAGHAPAAGEAEKSLRAWTGEGALEHLLLLAAGLDSAQLGETEIAGQLKQSLEISKSAGAAGPLLTRVVEEALRIARGVHHSTAVSTGRTSLAEIAIALVRERLAQTPGSAAMVGISPMTERCARALAEDGTSVLLVNRTPEHAQALAKDTGAEVFSLADFIERPGPVETVVCATGSAEPVLPKSALEKIAALTPSNRPPLVIDLAIPPDVDPQVAEAVGIERVGMDAITEKAQENRSQRLVAAADARDAIDRALDTLRRTLTHRRLAPLLAAVQKRFAETADAAVQRLVRSHLTEMEADQREAVNRWALTLARRLAHLPTEGLKGLALAHGIEAVEAFLERADPELLEVLRAPDANDGQRLDPVLSEDGP